ncbi:hypothetical protein MKZ38_007126 [Zalerion maritima]|uniref:DUF7730 domain-containing protein n=1 Tax=Zalerion maritima TaxID=339359 RepID=A0AAD5RJB8_9PEZI|nr:hypothetical protein MKZ38_007126 [Zalerion maritima]
MRRAPPTCRQSLRTWAKRRWKRLHGWKASDDYFVTPYCLDTSKLHHKRVRSRHRAKLRVKLCWQTVKARRRKTVKNIGDSFHRTQKLRPGDSNKTPSSSTNSLPDHDVFRSTAHNQGQSPFFNDLPEEVRSVIYAELWRSAGLSQHIFSQKIPQDDLSHAKDAKAADGHNLAWNKFGRQPLKSQTPPKPRSRFTHSRCITDYNPARDQRQDKLCADPEPGAQLDGRTIGRSIWGYRYASPWADHWKCWEELMGDEQVNRSERAIDEFDADAIHSYLEGDSSKFPRPSSTDRDPFLPMLTTCKRMYLECIQPIYENVTFSFMDTKSAEAFIGTCSYAGLRRMEHPTSPFALYARNINISLDRDFPKEVSCATNHARWDLHWIGLVFMQNIGQLNIWIDGHPHPVKESVQPFCERRPWWKYTSKFWLAWDLEDQWLIRKHFLDYPRSKNVFVSVSYPSYEPAFCLEVEEAHYERIRALGDGYVKFGRQVKKELVVGVGQRLWVGRLLTEFSAHPVRPGMRAGPLERRIMMQYRPNMGVVNERPGRKCIVM